MYEANNKPFPFWGAETTSVDSGLSTIRGKDGLWTNEEWAYLASTDAFKEL